MGKQANVLQNSALSITNTMNSCQREEIEENRKHVFYVALALLHLSRQGQALRGHDESEASAKKGNLIELLDSYTVLVPERKEKLARRYGHYTSPEYQNDIVHCLAQQLREKTVQSVKYWALLVDETKDVLWKEQLSFIIRFVGENGDVNEKPIGVYHMKHADAVSLTSAIIDIVDKVYNAHCEVTGISTEEFSSW